MHNFHICNVTFHSESGRFVSATNLFPYVQTYFKNSDINVVSSVEYGYNIHNQTRTKIAYLLYSER